MREADIKHALTHFLDSSLSTHPGLYLEELGLNGGEVRADLVHVHDMHCYEIKSEFDTLRRLVSQGSRYARVFDRVTLVLTESHLTKALPLLPSWWGVLLVTEEGKLVFKQIRPAKPNKRHEPEVLASLLKRDEALDLLNQLGGSHGWKSKSLYRIQSHIAGLLSLNSLRDHVRNYLLKRIDVAASQPI